MSFPEFIGWDAAVSSGAVHPFRVAVDLLCARVSPPGATSWVDINRTGRPRSSGGIRQASDVVLRLLKNPVIRLGGEIRPGQTTSTALALVLRDEDGFFGKKLPITVHDDPYNQCEIRQWYRMVVRLRNAHSIEVSTSLPFGIYLVHSVTRDSATSTATMNLMDFSEALNVKALDIRRGNSWFQNIRMPSLIEQLATKGSRNRIAISASVPADMSVKATQTRNFSVLGNVPIRTGTGDWNEKKQFIPRHQIQDGAVVFQVGLDLEHNQPAVARWDRSTGAWLYQLFGSAGYEGAFCSYSSTYCTDFLLLCAVSPRTEHPISTFGSNPLNHAHEIYWSPKNLASPPVMASSSNPVWITAQLVDKPHRVGYPIGTYLLWGSGVFTGYDNEQLLGVPFDCAPHAAGLDGYVGNTYWCPKSNEGGGVSRGQFTDTNADAGDISTALAGFGTVLRKGYYGMRSQGAGSVWEWPACTYAHAATHESFRYCPVRHAIYWMQIATVSGITSWYLCKWSLQSGTFSRQRLSMSDSTGEIGDFYRLQITAWDIVSWSATTGRLYIAALEHAPHPASAPMRFRLLEVAFSAGDITSGWTALQTAFSPADEEQRFDQGHRFGAVLCTLRVHSTGADVAGLRALYGNVLNYHNASGHSYGLWCFNLTNSGERHGGTYNYYPVLSTLEGRVSMPISTLPFEISPPVLVDDAWSVFAQDQATGHVWKLILNFAAYGSMTGEMISGGERVDLENTWSACNLLWDTGSWDATASSKLLGVSIPQSPPFVRVSARTDYVWVNELGETPNLAQHTPSGRISLWQWSREMSDVVKIADFGDSTVRQALEMCSDYCGNYIWGFERDVNAFNLPVLYFKPRPLLTPTIEIRDRKEMAIRTGVDIGAGRLTTTLDYNSIINSVEIPTYTARRADPTVSIVVRSQTPVRAAATVSAHQTSNESQTVVLTCLRAGVPQGGTFNGTTSPLLFSWARTVTEFVTALDQPCIPSANQIYVEGIYAEGAAFKIADTEISAGDFVQVEDGTLNTVLTVEANGRITFVSGQMVGGSAASFSAGSIVAFLPKYGSRHSSALGGVCSTTVSFAFSLTGFVFTMFVDDTSQLSVGCVVYSDSAYLEVVRIVSKTELCVNVASGLGSGGGKAACSTGVYSWPAGTTLRAAMWIKKPGSSYAIGGTGVSLTIDPRSIENDMEGLFVEGDMIRISCPGLTAVRDANTIVRGGRHADSIERHGKKTPSGMIDNRLMEQGRARIRLEAYEEEVDPHFLTVASDVPMLMTPEPGSCYYVRSKRLWPEADTSLGIDADGRVAHVVYAVEWDTAQVTSKLFMRSYIVAGGRAEAAEEPRPHQAGRIGDAGGRRR